MAPVERKSDHRGRLLLRYGGVAAPLFGHEFNAERPYGQRRVTATSASTETISLPFRQARHRSRRSQPQAMPDTRVEQLPMGFPRPASLLLKERNHPRPCHHHWQSQVRTCPANRRAPCAGHPGDGRERGATTSSRSTRNPSQATS